MKSQILADFVVEVTNPTNSTSEEGKWIVYVDGASSMKGSGIGVTMVGPEGETFNYALQLMFVTSNNVAEYEALLAGLRLVQRIGAKKVLMYSDSQLAVNQITGEYEVREEKLQKYLEELKRVCNEFEHVEIMYVPRGKNRKADALSKLAAEGGLDKDQPVIVFEMQRPSIEVEFIEQLNIEARVEWYSPIFNFLSREYLPADPAEAARIRRQSAQFEIIDGVLFKKSFSTPWQ
jgi:ribonuclease HI